MPKRKYDSEDEDLEQSEEVEVSPRPKRAKKAPAKKRNADSEDEQPAKKAKKAKKARQQLLLFIRTFMPRIYWHADALVTPRVGRGFRRRGHWAFYC